MVFAGYGILAPELNHDEDAGIDAIGKVVLILNRGAAIGQRGLIFSGKGNPRYSINTYRLFNAHGHGAIAILEMPDPNHSGPLRRLTATPAPTRLARGPGQQVALRPRIPSRSARRRAVQPTADRARSPTSRRTSPTSLVASARTISPDYRETLEQNKTVGLDLTYK